MHWSSLVLLVLTLSLAHADEQTISLDSLSRYTVNPAAPCGTLCQIKRAMAAWGDVMPAVKVPSLVSKYSRMRMDRKAVKALRVQSTKLQQRLGAVHRALSEVEGNRLDPDLEALRRLDAKASKLVGQVRIRGSKADTRAALEAAKLIDAEQAALTKFEIAVDDQRAIHTLKDQNKHLSTQLERLSGKLNQDPSSSSERNLGIQIKQLLQHSGEIEHKLTTQHSKLQHSSRLELEARIKRLARGYAHCVTQSEAVGELSKLEHEVSLVTQRKAAIDSGFDPNQAVGKVAVLHEVIAKAQHAIYQEMKGFLPTKSAKDQQRLTKIKNLVRHEQRNIERYQRLRDKLKQSSDISHTLALLERRSQRDLGDPMAEMRNSLKTLKRREPAKPSPQQSGPQAPAQLASEIDKLLEQTEAQREHRIQHTEAERTKSSSMQAGIAEMHRGLDKLGADSGVMKTKMAELKHESNGAGQEAGDDDVDLGESDEVPVETTSQQIDELLNAAAGAHEKDNPYLLESTLASQLWEPAVDFLQVDESDHIPFLTDDQSRAEFRKPQHNHNDKHNLNDKAQAPKGAPSRLSREGEKDQQTGRTHLTLGKPSQEAHLDVGNHDHDFVNALRRALSRPRA